mgnify:FL=1
MKEENELQDNIESVKTLRKPKEKKQRGQLFSIFLTLFGILILLSIISYSKSDAANGDVRFTDLYKIFFDDPVLARKAEATTNWLGLFGAIVSNFLINQTIGVFVVGIPILMIAWGFVILLKRDIKKILYATNYFLAGLFLFATLFGLIRLFGADNFISFELSGALGAFIALKLQQLIGFAGGFLLLFALIIALLVLSIDLDLQVTTEKLLNFFKSFSVWIKSLFSKNKSTEIKEVEVKRFEEPEIKKEKEIELNQNKEEEIIEEEVAEEESIEEKNSEELEVDIQSAQTEEEESDWDEREVEDEEIDYVFPSVELLDTRRQSEEISSEELKANAELLRSKLADFGVEVEKVSVTPGPVVTLYELVPATGVKISKITSLANDLALAMQARGIRIEAPIPGKGTVGVEIPNHNPQIVTIRSLINSTKYREADFALPIAMGKTISGEVLVDDLARMPHILIAGSTGSGKSIGINTLIVSLIYKLHPSELKFLMIDPKKIEMTLFRNLQNHFLVGLKDINEKIITTPQNAVLALKSVELEMEMRYDKLAAAGVRNIADYNSKFKDGKLKDTDIIHHKFLPYIVVIIDELADLMITAAREIEEPIARLAQLARAVGIHLIVATQRPSVDVITGVIKANFPARIAYAVSSKTDSRTILDMNGADQLLGNGDMLYLPSGSSKATRVQNSFISTEEVEAIVNHIGKQKGYSRPYELPSVLEKKRKIQTEINDTRDDLFEEAARVIVRHQQGSVSLLQRRLKVGYSRAARIVDELEAVGIVGTFDGSKAREVLVESEAELEQILRSL